MHYCVAIHYILALCVLQYIIYLHCLCCNTLNSCTVCCNTLNTCNVCCNTSGCVGFPLTSTPLPSLPLPSFFHQTRHWFLAVPWTSCAPERRPPSQSSLLSASRRWRRGGSTPRAFTGCQEMQQRSHGCGTLWTRVRSRENTYVCWVIPYSRKIVYGLKFVIFTIWPNLQNFTSQMFSPKRDRANF